MQDEMMSVLDLGCSGGGQVRSFIEQGYLAVGIEGSDLSARQLRAEWLTIPDYLFTADITKPFRLQTAKGREGMRFGVVTAWEVIEHIAEADLPQVLANVDAHLMPGGLVIMSVSPKSDIINGVELHQTVKPRAWWEAFLTASGWTNHPKLVSYFDGDFVRAEPNAPGSFHVVLSRRGEVPRLSARLQHLAATAN
jgi:cyclopropane fatty-acyl-phospholipid synthase-like methyltransferase